MALVTTADSDDEPTPRGICANLYHALCGAEPAVYVLTVLPCRNAPLLHDAHALATLHRLLVPPRDSSAARPRPSLRGGRLTAEEAPSHHPRVLRMRSFDFLPASGTAVCVRQWTPAGSLRDMLQGVSPEGEHGRKYFHLIQSAKRQVLRTKSNATTCTWARVLAPKQFSPNTCT